MTNDTSDPTSPADLSTTAGVQHAFRERGYHATTLDSIADQLGVRKTALYHYFPDKQGILLACHRESIADLERIVRDLRVHQILEGTNEIMRVITARELFRQ